VIDQKSTGKLEDFVVTEDSRILELPIKIFHPHRFLIMKILHAHGPVGFLELKQDLLNIGDGNLASHLRVLADEKYIISHKEFKDRKPRTTYELTPKGVDIFLAFKERLTKVLVNEH